MFRRSSFNKMVFQRFIGCMPLFRSPFFRTCQASYMNPKHHRFEYFSSTVKPSSAVTSLHFSKIHQQKRNITEDHKTKTIALWSNIRELPASPLPALTLGLAGLVPFIAPPVFIIYQGIYCSTVAFAQVAYGACILSFLGGVRWGFTLPEDNPVQPDWVNLGYSVMPSLIAWGGLLLPHPMSSFTLIGGLILAAYCDMAMYGYPPWFKALRFVLSFVAIMSLWTTFMCKLLISADKSSKDDDVNVKA